ncbi:related to alpha-N-acetylglucosaminidase [Rhynchosporium graminicola]|uniref:Related to alpha-N-acetylglucosaminidase n=1 Tax=Rhynchosporium graminicola TaxID=2792576 RepID=A0A1E1KG73_9HELO|nr:related to alpha-N-acetylglucosaminidase [Rhynchosporium commune]
MYHRFTVVRWIKLSTIVVFAAACLLVLRLQISKGGSEIMREIFPSQHFSISTEGIHDLIQRRMPHYTGCFELLLIDSFANSSGHDQYIISFTSTGKVLIEGTTPIAIACGLRRYLKEVAHVDIYSHVGSRLHTAPLPLPVVREPIHGASTVKWRYYLNTVTFSYTTAFWSWNDWELQLDWMALHGINLPLALVGSEKLLLEVFHEVGLTHEESSAFLSGPAFQSWNRLGNIHGSWHGQISQLWIDEQFSLNKRIVARMFQLGMTPVLPAFAGFVPKALSRAQPEARLSHGTQWSDFPDEYTRTSFLEPVDPLFQKMQKSFIEKQRDAYSDISHMYLLDQFNEINPSSNDPDFLRNLSHSSLQSLRAADKSATWVMPSWLFMNSDFWTGSLIETWFDGVEGDSNLIVLDLAAESSPQWQWTDSFHGASWIWCQLHNYGGNMGLGGQIMNLTINAADAVSSSKSLVGLGLSMEGQEQENQIVYDLLLDQAWSDLPIDTEKYFHDWVTARYSGVAAVPETMYSAWELMRTTIYNNTEWTSSAMSKSMLGLEPRLEGLVNRIGRHPTTIQYDPMVLVQAWRLVFNAAADHSSLWEHPAYLHDLVDITRQVIANEFASSYATLVNVYTSNAVDLSAVVFHGERLLALLDTLDLVLDTNENFRLATWILRARTSAGANGATADFYAREALNQVTLWGPNGEISDYASKDWSGLVSTFYKSRWKIFTRYLLDIPFASYNATRLHEDMLAFAIEWQNDEKVLRPYSSNTSDLQTVLLRAQGDWPSLFSPSR